MITFWARFTSWALHRSVICDICDVCVRIIFLLQCCARQDKQIEQLLAAAVQLGPPVENLVGVPQVTLIAERDVVHTEQVK